MGVLAEGRGRSQRRTGDREEALAFLNRRGPAET